MQIIQDVRLLNAVAMLEDLEDIYNFILEKRNAVVTKVRGA
jgi:hypothetical protein